VPPIGIRSAVSLGGIGAGSVELRGDGSLHEWTIFNQSPGGAAKTQVYDNAVLGLFIGSQTAKNSWLLRTQPPSGFPGVQQIQYGGAYPVSRLKISDPSIPGIETTLFAYSEFFPGNANASATPAFVISLNLYNPTS